MNDNTICRQSDPTCQTPFRGALNLITQFSGRANPDTDPDALAFASKTINLVSPWSDGDEDEMKWRLSTEKDDESRLDQLRSPLLSVRTSGEG